MSTIFRSPIEELVDRLFSEIKTQARRGELWQNPVTGGCFVWGLDPIALQKKEAVIALRAREWFAANGPAGAPPLPLSDNEIEDYRNARGLKGVIGFYARSLASQDYDVRKHPSFDNFARGLMAINTGLCCAVMPLDCGLEELSEHLRILPIADASIHSPVGLLLRRSEPRSAIAEQCFAEAKTLFAEQP